MHPKEELWLEGLRQGRPMRFQPLGGSMFPFLRQGDVVTIVAAPGRIGDIVLTRPAPDLLLHRLVARHGDRLITKGDALHYLDQPIAPHQVLGRACTKERHGRISRLDSLPARLCGLAFCLTLSFSPYLMPTLVKLKSLLQPGRA